jgi:acetyl esterase/lipase
MKRLPLTVVLLACQIFSSAAVRGQWSDSASRAVQIAHEYRVIADVTYVTANNYEARLDIYVPRTLNAPNKTMILIHGGGWVNGSKDASTLHILPYLEMGWSVVNIGYRLARTSLAPAAVEDCRCALRWVVSHAREYNFDTSKIVITGHSAGGHLALTTGMLPVSAGLDRECYPGNDEVKVAAIINWYGITDVADLLEGKNFQGYAVTWLGSQSNRLEVARRVSPLTYIRKELPPILTIHGDADPTVPYSHGVRLHEALNKAGVVNQLLTIPGGKHGGFSREENIRIFQTIRDFLNKNNL